MSVTPTPNCLTGPAAVRAGLFAAVLVALAALHLGCSPDSDEEPLAVLEQRSGSMAAAISTTEVAPSELDAMLLSEELIEGFRVQMGALAFAVRNLELPDTRTRRLFRPLDLQIIDLASEPEKPDPDRTLQSLGLGLRNWPIAEPTEATNISLRLWRPLFDKIDRFDWTGFKIKSGHFVENSAGEPVEFEMRVAFSGLARLHSGQISWIRTMQTLRWRLISGLDSTKNKNWRIVFWHSDTASRLDAPSTLFEDVIDQAVPDLAQRETARVSIHERLVAARLLAKREGGRSPCRTRDSPTSQTIGIPVSRSSIWTATGSMISTSWHVGAGTSSCIIAATGPSRKVPRNTASI
jgi:hypothetical protein